MLLDPDIIRSTLGARPAKQQVGERRAAVAVILRGDGKSSDILVIQRARHERDPWSGHLAFPGGRADLSDADLCNTAIRETREELGLDLTTHSVFLGALDQIHTRGRGLPELVIAPFVFALTGNPTLVPDQREVDRAFWVPIGPLLSGECDTTVTISNGTARFRLPGYQIEDQILWGLTYQMLQSFLGLLGDPR